MVRGITNNSAVTANFGNFNYGATGFAAGIPEKCFIWAQVSRKAGLEHQTHSGEHGTVNYLMGMTRTTSFGLNKELIMPQHGY